MMKTCIACKTFSRIHGYQFAQPLRIGTRKRSRKHSAQLPHRRPTVVLARGQKEERVAQQERDSNELRHNAAAEELDLEPQPLPQRRKDRQDCGRACWCVSPNADGSANISELGHGGDQGDQVGFIEVRVRKHDERLEPSDVFQSVASALRRSE